MLRPVPQLMRHFIHDKLYGMKNNAYFDQVSILRPRINFTELADQQAYQAAIAKLYADTKGQAWHTPSELFSPHYGQAIVHWILGVWDEASPLRIYEIGPGNGTLAHDIITELVELGIDRLEYHGIELSPQLAAMQRKQLAHLMPRYYHLHQGSMLDWRKREEEQAFILAMEVLDNLPHDLIRFNAEGHLEQASVQEGNQIIWQVATDPLTIRLVEKLEATKWKWPSLQSQSILRTMLNLLLSSTPAPDCEWIPTSAYRLLEVISECFAKPCLFMSDFDSLPQTIGLGNSAPLIQGRENGELKVYDSILQANGQQDIMFPTDFEQIALLWQLLQFPRPMGYSIQSHAEFFEKWADWEQFDLRSGWNPLLQDFRNVKVFSSR